MPENLFAACRIGEDLVAKRVRLDNSVQQAIETVFGDQERVFRQGVASEVAFDGSWKPDEDEVLTIDILQEAALFANTINANAVAIPDIDTARFEAEGIKALFTGATVNGATKVLVQGFLPQQILSRRFSLFQDGNAFRRLSNPAFTLDNSLTCIVEDGKIKFKSFHKLRTILNLLDVYKAATDQEVQDFAGHASFEVVADIAAFLAESDQTTRKLIHAIARSGILAEHTVAEIRTAATGVGIPVTVANGKLVIPTSRGEIKQLLRFLDDGLYKAPLTHRRYITNSKRLVV